MPRKEHQALIFEVGVEPTQPCGRPIPNLKKRQKSPCLLGFYVFSCSVMFREVAGGVANFRCGIWSA